MTLSELRLIEAALEYSKISALMKNVEPTALAGIVASLVIIEREIKLKTINPVTGNVYIETEEFKIKACPECKFINGHSSSCSQGRD